MLRGEAFASVLRRGTSMVWARGYKNTKRVFEVAQSKAPALSRSLQANLEPSKIRYTPIMPRVKHVRRNDTNPLVYFDVAISGGPTGTVDLGRVVFELYNDIAPKVYACTAFAPLLSAPAGPQTPTLLQLQKLPDCRKLPPAVYWGNRHRKSHHTAATLQRLSVPQNHKRFHDPRG